jgi:hypothetical protein
MPLVSIHSNVDLPANKQGALLLAASKSIAELTGKPEAYVMTLFTHAQGMTMAGKQSPCCLVDVRGIGRFTPDQTRAISHALCALVERESGVPSNRVYLNFVDFSGAMWGHDGSTFG